MAKITYTNKVTLNPQPSIADENKVTSGDMNEIKNVVNGLIVNSYSTDNEKTYSCDYMNSAFGGLIKSLQLTGTTNQNGEVDITSLNSNLIPSKVVILQVAVVDKIPSVNTNSTGSTLFVMFRNRGTTYSPVAQNTSITFTIYYIEI